MKCYLHIGTEKTATTTIQKFLDINRRKLLDLGYIYTRSAGQSNNRKLPVAAYNLDRRDDYTRKHKLQHDAQLASFQLNTVKNLKKEVQALRTSNPNAEKIVFSSEHIQSRLTEDDEIFRLKKILVEIGVTCVYVIVYVRRPAEIAGSLFSTAIKTGALLDRPPLPSNPYWNTVCNHKRTIQKFGRVFGSDAIVPRLYNKKEFIGGSILSDFRSAIGLPEDSYKIPDNANKSLSMLGINILRHLNNTVPKWIDDTPNPTRRDLVSYVEKHFSRGKYVMPQELYRLYDSNFQESDEWIRANYFSGRDRLFDRVIPAGSESSLSDADLKLISEFIADIWCKKLIEEPKPKRKILVEFIKKIFSFH